MDLYRAQRLIGEDVIGILQERFMLLETVKLSQPVGRRRLVALLKMTERKVRSHLEYLEKKELIVIDQRGVMLKEDIEDITPFLLEFFKGFNSSVERETQLAALLGLERVIIAPGDSASDKAALANIGLLAANVFYERISKSSLIAVSGGASMKAFSDALRTTERRSCTVIPVRGAIGASHSIQANTIALLTGMKLSCNALQLPIPDNIGPELLDTLKKHPDIVAVTSLYRAIDVVVFGIGTAASMMEHRGLTAQEKRLLSTSNAVAEAVGYYFAKNGRILKKASDIGLANEEFRRIPVKIALAGGEEKADAVIAFSRFLDDITLVTDEVCASAMIKKMQGEM